MKVKTISRPDDFVRERVGDIYKVSRNLNPVLHPHERAREYTRALNATKLDRLFAKPFLGSLNGHIDGIYAMAKHPTQLTTLYSGSADGEIRIWNLSNQETTWKCRAHKTFIRGICAVPFQSNFVSVGEDKVVHLWSPESQKPVTSFISQHVFSGIDHHRKDKIFATSSGVIDLWDHNRSEPIQTMQWGAESILGVKFNQTETSVLASYGTDRTIILYDIRTATPISKVIMNLRTNSLAWNPMEAFNFSTANEDHNCYTFDMRYLNNTIAVAKGHVSAVMDIDYSPTGEEFVTASYDKSIRIFRSRDGTSRDVYHTKRMQRYCIVTIEHFVLNSLWILSLYYQEVMMVIFVCGKQTHRKNWGLYNDFM
jgi:DDB1- and CUL4-associated factor 13